jgi:hypothetical protein
MRLLTIGNKLWENHDLTLQLVMTYIYLCEWVSASCLSYFSNSPSVMDQKLNWNVTQALEKTFTIGILSYTDSWWLVPFSSNVLGPYSKPVSVLTKRMRTVSCVIHKTSRTSLQRDTRQEYSYTNLAATHLFPITATQDRVKQPSHWNVSQSTLCSSFLEKKMN